MGHHKTGHHRHEDDYKVGKSNAQAAEKVKAAQTPGIPEESLDPTALGSTRMLREKVRELRAAGGDAWRELRSGIGTAAEELRHSAAKAALRFEKVLRSEKAEKGGPSEEIHRQKAAS